MTTHVADCGVANCSFNDHSACTAAAITVGGSEDHASCATFIDTGAHGGLPKVLADVGACQRVAVAVNRRRRQASASITARIRHNRVPGLLFHRQ
jgi:hypothetical protein